MMISDGFNCDGCLEDFEPQYLNEVIDRTPEVVWFYQFCGECFIKYQDDRRKLNA